MQKQKENKDKIVNKIIKLIIQSKEITKCFLEKRISSEQYSFHKTSKNKCENEYFNTIAQNYSSITKKTFDKN